MNKFYKGKRRYGSEGREGLGKIEVTVDNKPLKHHVSHSPAGFEWGYAGSGPADLAISILWDFLGEEPDHRTAMEYKNDIVSNLDREEWLIEEYEIENWYETNIISGHAKDQRLGKQLKEEEEKRNQRKCICQRWGIVDKVTGKEIGTLGWYTNSSKEEVRKHAENNGIKFEENEEIQIVEEQ